MVVSALEDETPANTWCDTEVKATLHSVEEVFEDFGVGCRARPHYLQTGQEYIKEVRVICPNGPQAAQQSSNARFWTKSGPDNLRLLSLGTRT